MGIYDREYYREESRAGWLFAGLAPTCKMLILINVAVFLVRYLSPNANRFLHDWFALNTYDLFHRGAVWQLVTSAFLHSHSDAFHIIFNMLTLWLVGTEMETMYGRREFLAMYLSAAVFSGLCWAISDEWSGGMGTAVGASGAIMAVVVLFAMFYPRRTILIYGLIPVEMWLLATIYIGGDLLVLLSTPIGADPGNRPHRAIVAHLGGAAYGYLYKRFDLRWSRLLSRVSRRPRLRVVSAEPRRPSTPSVVSTNSNPPRSSSPSVDLPRATPPGPSFPEEQLNARLDEVLAKILSQGRETLTEEELRILQEASRRARSRRDEAAH